MRTTNVNGNGDYLFLSVVMTMATQDGAREKNIYIVLTSLLAFYNIFTIGHISGRAHTPTSRVDKGCENAQCSLSFLLSAFSCLKKNRREKRERFHPRVDRACHDASICVLAARTNEKYAGWPLAIIFESFFLSLVLARENDRRLHRVDQCEPILQFIIYLKLLLNIQLLICRVYHNFFLLW